MEQLCKWCNGASDVMVLIVELRIGANGALVHIEQLHNCENGGNGGMVQSFNGGMVQMVEWCYDANCTMAEWCKLFNGAMVQWYIVANAAMNPFSP